MSQNRIRSGNSNRWCLILLEDMSDLPRLYHGNVSRRAVVAQKTRSVERHARRLGERTGVVGQEVHILMLSA